MKSFESGLPLRFLSSFFVIFCPKFEPISRVFIVQMVIFGEIWSVFIFNIFTIRPLFRLVFAVWVFLHYKQQHSWALRSNSCPVETVAARYFLFKDSLKVKIFRLRTKDSNSPTMLKQINSSPWGSYRALDTILGFLEVILVCRLRKTDKYYEGHLLHVYECMGHVILIRICGSLMFNISNLL